MIWASLADVARRESLVLTLCPIVGILQSLSSNAFPTGLTHRISKGVTFDTSCRRYERTGTLYHKLVAFIPPAKDEWDFCRRVLKLDAKNRCTQSLYALYSRTMLIRCLILAGWLKFDLKIPKSSRSLSLVGYRFTFAKISLRLEKLRFYSCVRLGLVGGCTWRL